MELSETHTGQRGQLLRRAAGYAFKMFIALRVGTLAWVFLLSLLGGRSPSEPDVLCRSGELLESSLSLGIGLSAWLRWDTICYLIIAESGYANPGLTVWPPFYPLLIRLFSFVFMPPILAALVISSLATWLAFFLLYVFVTESHDETTAKNTLFLYAIYPVAFFLVAGYTESLFLALAIGSLWLARRKAWFWTGILAALATLTRNQGILLSAVLLWEGILQYREKKGLQVSEVIQILLSASLPILTFGAFALYVHNGLDAGWPWATLGVLWGQYTGFPWEGVIGSLRQLSTLLLSQDLYWLPTTILDLVLAILIPIVLIVQRRTMRSTYMLFAWLVLLIALSKLGPGDTLVSFSRYMIAAFPFFVSISPIVSRRSIKLVLLPICLVFQAVLLSMFYIWSWAG